MPAATKATMVQAERATVAPEISATIAKIVPTTAEAIMTRIDIETVTIHRSKTRVKTVPKTGRRLKEPDPPVQVCAVASSCAHSFVF
jgi:hypothetical protein